MPGATYSAIQQVMQWYWLIMGIIAVGAVASLSVMGLGIITSNSEMEQAHVKRRIKHTLFFVMLAMCMFTIVRILAARFGFY